MTSSRWRKQRSDRLVFSAFPPSPLRPLPHPAAIAAGVSPWCKRDDHYTPAPGTALQGNKVRKLEPVLQRAIAAVEKPLLVSFGGAYSNHISALATAGRLYAIPVHLYVRGEEADNPLLDQARRDGASITLLSRSEYREKTGEDWLRSRRAELAQRHRLPQASIWFIPEGGTTPEGVRNVGKLYGEVVADLGHPPDFLCVSAGTGGTAAGIIQAATPETRVEVYPALKGDWMAAEIRRLLDPGASRNWTCITDYHFGGYGKFPGRWIVPSKGIATRADIGVRGLPPLEPIYNAKLFSGVLNRIEKGVYPPGSSVVVVHTGGIY